MEAAQLDELASLRSEAERIAGEAGLAAPETPGDDVSYSFGIFSSSEQKIAEIAESIRETLAKLAPVASLEMVRDGFAARSVINYSGLAVSVWSSGTTAELVEAHLQSLQSAYVFRAAVTGVVAALGNAVAAISVAVANPLTVAHAVRSVEALRAATDRLAAAVAASADASAAY